MVRPCSYLAARERISVVSRAYRYTCVLPTAPARY